MVQHKQAFTLIELLVVVLIIGILAAVALPQYQKVVKKARLTEWITVVNSLSKAIDVWLLSNDYPTTATYFTGNGNGSVDYASLDIDIPWNTSNQTNSFNKLGSWQAICSVQNSQYLCEVCTAFSAKLNLGSHTICVTKYQYNGYWALKALTGDKDENVKLLCQEWATHHGTDRMTEGVKTKCASLGIE
ncbi:MAG: prepilin-type N-terminal cleavage/methylation domain-containing protein [Elusimicrobiaceae bacterium]|nr:prepilin-type N-terminal cleavage/methylation domain-containing protein [Elusimicrobiaceae bacterium]